MGRRWRSCRPFREGEFLGLAQKCAGVFIWGVSSKNTSGGKYLKAFTDTATLLVIAACVAGILASVAWYFELVTHFAPYLFGMACLTVVVNLVCGRWWRLLACTSATVFFGLQLLPFYYPQAGEPTISVGRVYTALLLNLRRDNKRPEEVVEFLKKQKAEILLLEEVTPAWERRLRPILGDYKYEIVQTRENAFGIWLLSTLPLSDREVLPVEEANVPYVTATVDCDGQPLRFVGVHPVPPTGRGKARDRNDRLDGAGETLRKEKGHRMILGDLNCTPWSPYFQRLLESANVLDTSVGRGLHPTWYPGIPLIALPLDHCLVSPSIVLVSRTVGPDVGSDHRPLLVEFSLLEASGKK
jgi:endonuclease/exonuclease/phosphatase (EEP) superfamily protein YafD